MLCNSADHTQCTHNKDYGKFMKLFQIVNETLCFENSIFSAAQLKNITWN